MYMQTPPLLCYHLPPNISRKGARAITSISVSRLSHLYDSGTGSLEVLRDVSLDVPPSEFVSLIGPSGCGKTTLLRAIGGLTDATSGSITLSGMLPRELQQRKGIGFVSQDAALLPWRTALENVRLPFQLNADSVKSDSLTSAKQTLNAVGLAEFTSYYPHQLSGGMRQRVAFARALAISPGLLLMDEPLSALDEMTREEMRYELLRLWERQRPTVIFVTHSIPEAVALSDRVVVLSARPGRIVDDVTIDLPRPRLQEVERSDRFLKYMYKVKDALTSGIPQ
jgi:NitT/TauT family transport system ATP-binding protein